MQLIISYEACDKLRPLFFQERRLKTLNQYTSQNQKTNLNKVLYFSSIAAKISLLKAANYFYEDIKIYRH